MNLVALQTHRVLQEVLGSEFFLAKLEAHRLNMISQSHETPEGLLYPATTETK